MMVLKQLETRVLIPAMFAIAILSTLVQARVVFVDTDARGANDGSSWPDAYLSLQDALQSSTMSDEIRVAQGIYRPDQHTVRARGGYALIESGDRSATFLLKNGVTVRGGFAGFGKPDPDARDVYLYKTILSGDLQGDDGPGFLNRTDNSIHVVTCTSTNLSCLLDGVTIAGGYANAKGLVPESQGGGVYNTRNAALTVSNCTIHGNFAIAHGASIFSDINSKLILNNCKIFGNDANFGGGVYVYETETQITNCAFYDNTAKFGAGMTVDKRKLSQVSLKNCTFTGNRGRDGGGGIWLGGQNTMTLVNSILWNDSPDEIKLGALGIDGADVSYCDVQGGWPGIGNIDVDPLFVDLEGLDDIPGTEDDDFRLSVGSPCIGAGDNSVFERFTLADLGGNTRILDQIVDMGAYEGAFRPTSDVYYVNAVTGDDRNQGISPKKALATVQAGIDATQNGNAVLVYPGIYTEGINFWGKAITVKGVPTKDGIPILENPSDFAVSFDSGEGPDSYLQNFVIRNSDLAVFIVGSSPTLNHLTLVNNNNGIEAYAGGDPIIVNSILWQNTAGDLFQSRAHYSCLERVDDNPTNISADPLFVDLALGDYHLLSNRGRHWILHDVWVLDKVTSPCIDAGDPESDATQESLPNGGRVNLGAYGGTPFASLSEAPPIEAEMP